MSNTINSSASGSIMVADQGGVSKVAFSPDGKLLLTTSVIGTLQLWDFVSKTPYLDPMHGKQSIVRGVAFSPDGKQIISGGSNGTLKFWDVASGRSLDTPISNNMPSTLPKRPAFSATNLISEKVLCAIEKRGSSLYFSAEAIA